MGSKPSPEEQVRRQQELNRGSMRDAAQFNQIGQQNPWGESRWEGEIGSPDRKQITTLNQADQGRLDQTRTLKGGLAGRVAWRRSRRSRGPGRTRWSRLVKAEVKARPVCRNSRHPMRTPPYLPEVGRNQPMNDHTIYEERIGR